METRTYRCTVPWYIEKEISSISELYFKLQIITNNNH